MRSSSIPSPQSLETSVEEEEEILQEPEGTEDTKRTRPSVLTKQDIYEVIKIEAASPCPTWHSAYLWLYPWMYMFFS